MVLSMERWKGKTAVVTGASSGIGAAIVKALVEHGVNVVGVARRSEKVEELAKKLPNVEGKIYGVKADLTVEEDILNAFKWTINNVGPISILVNCAGIHIRTSLIDSDTEPWRKTIDTNLLAVCIASREAIKNMRENNIDGHIINLNSILGHYTFNGIDMDVYPATKYGITAYTECLRMELMNKGSKIRVTSLSPGVVDTEIFSEEYRAGKSFQNCIGENLLQAEDIADGAIYALSTPPHVQVHELTIKPIGEKF